MPTLPSPGGSGVHGDHVAGQRAGLDRRELQRADAALGLDPRRLHRLARLGGDGHRQVVLALGHQLRGAVEHGGALVGREAALGEGLDSRLSRLVDQSAIALGHPPDQGLVVGGLHLRPLAGLDPLTRDVELVICGLDRLGRHVLSLVLFCFLYPSLALALNRNFPPRYPLSKSSASGDPTTACCACVRSRDPGRRRVGQGLDRQWSRLRTRGRHEPVRRLRLRQARLQVRPDPHPLLHGHHHRNDGGQDRSRPASRFGGQRRLPRRELGLRDRNQTWGRPTSPSARAPAWCCARRKEESSRAAVRS